MYEIVTKTLPFAVLSMEFVSAGADWQVLFQGGGRPHIRCTVLAQPRLSLSGSGETSCTASVINLSGHKDEAVCREIAERLCTRLGTVVVCSGGFHLDGISREQILQVQEAAREMADQRLRERER